jgi:hypothetical protein
MIPGCGASITLPACALREHPVGDPRDPMAAPPMVSP